MISSPTKESDYLLVKIDIIFAWNFGTSFADQWDDSFAV